ncbi:MAG TPA: hypothetical protein VGI81_17730 [Tepidisphaeraceae bacterium]
MTRGWGVERVWSEDGSLQTEIEFLLKDPFATRRIVYDDLGKPHRVFLWNGKPVSKTKFYERLARELEIDIATAESLRQPINPPAPRTRDRPVSVSRPSARCRSATAGRDASWPRIIWGPMRQMRHFSDPGDNAAL